MLVAWSEGQSILFFFLLQYSLYLFAQIPQIEEFSFHLLSTPILILVLSLPATLSEIGILAAAVGGACGVILILLCIFVAVRFYRKKHMENDIEMHSREQEWRDPTVWWGLESRSSSAPLLLRTGVELIGYLGPLCWRTQRNIEGEKASLSSMFASPLWAFQILLLSIYFSITHIMYHPFHSPRLLHCYMFYQKLPVIIITNLTQSFFFNYLVWDVNMEGISNKMLFFNFPLQFTAPVLTAPIRLSFPLLIFSFII